MSTLADQIEAGIDWAYFLDARRWIDTLDDEIKARANKVMTEHLQEAEDWMLNCGEPTDAKRRAFAEMLAGWMTDAPS